MAGSGFYTAEGDGGDTGRLASKERIAKSSMLIEAVGTIDEATACIGVARALSAAPRLREALPEIQRHLIELMAHLSAAPDARSRYSGVTEQDLSWLQTLIADLEKGLPPLVDFVLPGDSPAGAALHVARTVVRRAERRLVAVAEEELGISETNLAYLNRLSSLLFVAALVEDAESPVSSP